MAITKIQPINLTDVGTTTPINLSSALNASFNLTTAGVVTNVVLRAEYSLDNGTTWTNINAADSTVTGNTQIVIPALPNNISLPLVRLNFVSKTGGTPTVTGRLRYTK